MSRDVPASGGAWDVLDSPAWSQILERFGRGTGLSVYLRDRNGRLRAGPFATSPLGLYLSARGSLTDASVADVDAVAADSVARRAVTHGRAFDTLAIVAVPVLVAGSVEGVVVAGWVHDQFPDPLSTDRLAKRLEAPCADLWQLVRQQPPVGHDKMLVYGELLDGLVDAVARERTETLREREHARQLLALNTSARCMAAADDETAVADAVVDAAHVLVRAETVRLVVAGAEQNHLSEAGSRLAAPRGLTTSLRIPVSLPDGSTLAVVEIDNVRGDVSDPVQRHLEALAAQAANALQKVRRFDVVARRQEALARTNKAKDEFLSVLSHEMRTPLTPILGWAAMLRRGLLQGQAGSVAHAVDAIERNARQQLQLVDEMLDLSRLLNNKVQLEPEPVRPLDALATAVASAQDALATRRLRLDMDVPHALPSVLADPRRLQQVLGNLIANAIKFTADDGEITVGAHATADGVEFSVRDTGIGLLEDELSVIFDRFHQADSSSTRQQGGLGIGLSVVKGLVELHGGRAWATSPGPGRGSTFVVRFPAIQASADADAGSGRGSEKVGAGLIRPLRDGEDEKVGGGLIRPLRVGEGEAGLIPPLRSEGEGRARRLLLVDDCDDSVDMLRFMLEAEGYQVSTAPSVALALERAHAQPPDIIVSDIGMPVHDGYDLVRRVRASATLADTPVVALTGYASQGQRDAAVEAGFTAHIAKPVDPDVLIALLRTVLGDRAGHRSSL